MVDDNEHVSATQYDNEAAEENMEVVGSDERHLQYADQRNNDTNGLNVNEGCHALQANEAKLTLPSHVSHPKWLAEAMMNLNQNIVTDTNDQNLNMPL